MRGAKHQQRTPHHEGGQTTKQHGRLCGGPQASTARPTFGGAPHRHSTPHSGRGAVTDTARPTMGGGTHQCSKPHQEGGHAPAQHPPPPTKQHSPNGYATADHSYLNTPTVGRRRRRQTNKKSGAWRRLNKRRRAPANTSPTRTQRRQSPGGPYDDPTPAPPHHA